MKSSTLLAALPLAAAAEAANNSTAPYAPNYDTTWAGPVQIAARYNSSLNSSGFFVVEATLIMPKLTVPEKPREEVGEYTASFWVGLDGFVLSDITAGVRGLWQAGVIMSVWENGSAVYRGFYEWVPNDPTLLTQDQLAISEDAHIHVLLNTTNSGYHGTVVLKNLNTSQSYDAQDAPTA